MPRGHRVGLFSAINGWGHQKAKRRGDRTAGSLTMATAQGSEEQACTTDRDRQHRPVVVLAEDNDDTRRVYGLILRHFGYCVEEATNGHDAVQLVKAARPNLVLMDIGLPGIDGWQASHILKSDPETTSIPLIAFSALVDSTDDLTSSQTFDGYIIKPVSPMELVRRVNAYMELLT